MRLLVHAVTVLILSHTIVYAQTSALYFPPIADTTWETVAPEHLYWNTAELDTLFRFLANNESKGFIVLKDGKIALEWYSDGFKKTDVWYWASAGKVVTATLVGIAQNEGKLRITSPSSTYQGVGWTSLNPDAEQQISVWHQLTMTSGLDDGVVDPFCTDKECLQYKAEPGTRWAYHNAPYTLLDAVLEGATGLALNTYFTQKIKSRIGMDGLFAKSGFNNVLVSTPRSMARFGLLALAGFIWNESENVVPDKDYCLAMIQPSQNLNKSYGYLWWLNGKESFMLPSVQYTFPGPLVPNAPFDAFFGLGANDQILCVVPSERLVVIRMGNEAKQSGSAVPTQFVNELWKLLRNVIGQPSTVTMPYTTHSRSLPSEPTPVVVVDITGRVIERYPSHFECALFRSREPYIMRVVYGNTGTAEMIYVLQP